MEFFNKKEEVIELVLTQKGRELFSQGKLNPVYYSFHDTDINYDDGSNEEQNNAVPRIKNTPTLKSIIDIKQPTSSNFKQNQKQFILKNELGSKTLGDQYAPAWNIKFLKTPPFQWYGTDRNNITDNKKYQLNFSSSIDYDSSKQELIPQFNIQTLYQVYDVNDLSKNKFSLEFPKQDYSLNAIRKTLVKLFAPEFITQKIKKTQKFGFTDVTIEQEIIVPNFDFIKETKNVFGVELDVYKIFNKFLEKQVFYPVEIFNSAFNDFYNESILVLATFFNQLLSFQLNTVDEFIDLLNNGFKTDYIYTYDEVLKFVNSFSNLTFVLNSFKVADLDGVEIEFYDRFDNPFKLVSPNYKIFKSLWLVKDPKLLIDFQELNTYETNEQSKYELNYYWTNDDGVYYKNLTLEEVREYINISFDSVADLENLERTKNIYDSNKTDDSTC